MLAGPEYNMIAQCVSLRVQSTSRGGGRTIRMETYLAQVTTEMVFHDGASGTIEPPSGSGQDRGHTL